MKPQLELLKYNYISNLNRTTPSQTLIAYVKENDKGVLYLE